MNRSSLSRVRSVFLEVESLEERRVLSTASYVTGLYTTLLNRAPQPAEVGMWSGLIDGGILSPEQVANAITTSTEFRANLIETDYQQLLGRTPSAQELVAAGALQQGMPEQQLADMFLGSTEFYQDHGATPAGFLDGVYQDELGRAPDPAAETLWLNSLANGLPRTTVATAIASSPEALARVVTQDYEQVLGRAPDAAGLASWVGELAAGLQPSRLLTSLASSQEFINVQGGLDSQQNGFGVTADDGGSSAPATPEGSNDTSSNIPVVVVTTDDGSGSTGTDVPGIPDNTDTSSGDDSGDNTGVCDCSGSDNSSDSGNYNDPGSTDTSDAGSYDAGSSDTGGDFTDGSDF